MADVHWGFRTHLTYKSMAISAIGLDLTRKPGQMPETGVMLEVEPLLTLTLKCKITPHGLCDNPNIPEIT